MIGGRTMRRVWRATQGRVYDLLDLHSMMDDRHRRSLEAVMGFPGQWDEHRRFQMDLLLRLGLEPGQRLLEIGCGPLTLGVPAIRFLDDGGYTGVDIRESATDVAWREIAENSLSGRNPRILRSDDFGSAHLQDDSFDVAWAFSVLFHLEDGLVDDLFRLAARVLRPHGVFVGNINTSVDESRWLEFPFLRRQPAFYATAAGRHGLTMDVLGSLQELGFRSEALEKDNIVLRFHRA